jgi:hypothetical protein
MMTDGFHPKPNLHREPNPHTERREGGRSVRDCPECGNPAYLKKR